MTEQIRLTSDAMNLAHDLAIHEGELRDNGAHADRLSTMRAKKFGYRIASLARRDPTASLIIRPETDLPVEPQPSGLSQWGLRTHEANMAAAGKSGVRDLAFKD